MIAKFSAIQCDERWSERFRRISNIKTIGIKTVIAIDTDEEVNIDYMVKMAKELESMPVIDHKYLVKVRPILKFKGEDIMSCKYPETSRSHKFCIGCRDKYMCEDSTVSTPEMPNVKPPKTDESNIEKAIKLLIDNGYSVAKNQAIKI